MATQKQKEAAKENIEKAQEKWQEMSPQARSRAQPEGEERAKPGSGGEGDYYHVEVRPESEFTGFRTHDIGREGHSKRVAGHRSSGSWDTQKWLISKKDAHIEDGKLVADDPKVKEILDQLQTTPEHIEGGGDRFKAKPRKNVPEEEKPTEAQKKARQENIKKAQEARRKD